MKLKVIFGIFSIMIFTSFYVYSDDDDDPSTEEASAFVGKNMAVVSASKTDGVELSDKAKVSIGIKTEKLPPDHTVPSSALIHERSEVGIYVLRENRFKYVEVEIENAVGTRVKLESKEVSSGEDIVVEGAALLRLAEINVWSSSEGGDDD